MRSGKIPVFGLFANDAATALKSRLNDLGENRKNIAVRIDECFALENGIEGVILAILNVPPKILRGKEVFSMIRGDFLTPK